MIMFSEGNVPDVQTTGQSSIVGNLSEFQKNFNCFSNNALLELDWANVFAAGGACVASLLPVDKQVRRAVWFNPASAWENNKDWQAWKEQTYKNEDSGTTKARHLYPRNLHQSFFKRSRFHKSHDIDLFIYGLDAQQAIAKIQSIHAAILETCVTPPLVIINGHAVTFYREFPLRSIQVVSRLYKSPSEILLGFDIDSCCVGYDGTQVWVAPRTIRALNTRCNVVDMSRRSLSYETRLFKYARRNFAVVVPDIVRNEIDPQLFDSINLVKSYDMKGLAKLIMHEMTFRDYRVPSCKCLSRMQGVQRHVNNNNMTLAAAIDTGCLQRKLNRSKLPTASHPPVSMREIYIHRMSGGWQNDEATYRVVGPTAEDDRTQLANEMRGIQSLRPRGTKDYEYLNIPWKKGTSIEMVHAFLNSSKFCSVFRDLIFGVGIDSFFLLILSVSILYCFRNNSYQTPPDASARSTRVSNGLLRRTRRIRRLVQLGRGWCRGSFAPLFV
jgi:hypothetical protein